MSTDPWTADDPQLGDFDAALTTIPLARVEHHGGDPTATLRILVSVDGDDVSRLARLAAARGTTAHELIAEVLRDADSVA